MAAAFAGATLETSRRYFSRAVGTALVWGGTWTGLGYLLGTMLTKYFHLLA